MKPAIKSSEMDLFLERVVGKNRTATIESGRCMTCDGDAMEFRDVMSIKEYRISGMCQDCQDEVFKD